MSTPEIEARLTLLETEVAHLKQQLPAKSQAPWWEKISGHLLTTRSTMKR